MKKNILFLVVILAIVTGCATRGKHRNGKIRPGKAIPCPQKDC
jgi:hypothetical protein